MSFWSKAGRVTSGLLTGGMSEKYYYQPKRQEDIQKQAQTQAEENARTAQRQADEAFNAANQKEVDAAGILRKQKRNGQSTLLTGPTGAESSTLGRKTLLGQ